MSPVVASPWVPVAVLLWLTHLAPLLRRPRLVAPRSEPAAMPTAITAFKEGAGRRAELVVAEWRLPRHRCPGVDALSCLSLVGWRHYPVLKER